MEATVKYEELYTLVAIVYKIGQVLCTKDFLAVILRYPLKGLKS